MRTTTTARIAHAISIVACFQLTAHPAHAVDQSEGRPERRSRSAPAHRPQHIVVAGGVGSRLWPASTKKKPKQNLILVPGDRSMLRMTVDRMSPDYDGAHTLVVTSTGQKDRAGRDLMRSGVPEKNIIGEPYGRNTGPAIALAAGILEQTVGRDTPFTWAWSDHLIKPEPALRAAIAEAARVARDHDRLIALTVAPTSPHTGFGYLERGPKLAGEGATAVYGVERFAEKPDPEVAQRFMEGGRHFWNTGITTGHVGHVMDRLQQHRPHWMTALRPAIEAYDTGRFPAALKAAYDRILDPDSIDVALMTPEGLAGRVGMIAPQIEWADIGDHKVAYQVADKDRSGNAVVGGGRLETDWGVIHQLHSACKGREVATAWRNATDNKDRDGNVVVGGGEIFTAAGAENNYVATRGRTPVAIVGLKNIAVVENDKGEILVMPIGSSNDDALRAGGRNYVSTPRGTTVGIIGMSDVAVVKGAENGALLVMPLDQAQGGMRELYDKLPDALK